MITQKLSAILQVNVPSDASTSHSLLPGQVFAARGSAVRKLDCSAGTLWITLEGDAKDYFLDAGSSMNLGSKGKFVVSALGRASFSLA